MSTTATETPNVTSDETVEIPEFVPTDDFKVETTPEGLTKQARTYARSWSQGVLKAETFVYHLAEILLAFAATCVAPEYSPNVKDPSKQKGYRKPGSQECPDYGMQSAEFKAWRAANVDSIVASVITDPKLYESVVTNRLRYRVQTLRSKTVDKEILKSLNLSTESQSERQARIAAENAERARNATQPIGGTLFDEARALQTETVGENQPIPVHEIASAVGIAIEAWNKRLDADTLAAMGEKEKQTLASLCEQYEATLAAMRATMLSEVSEQVAA